MFRVAFVLALSAAVAVAVSDPWSANQTLRPDELAARLQRGETPIIFMVGPRILYNGDHIRGASYAGPAGGKAGLALLRQSVASVPKSREIILYCGCCPMEKCPNIRPAFQELTRSGFSNVKVLVIPTNLVTDWTQKGYPVEKGEIPKL